MSTKQARKAARMAREKAKRDQANGKAPAAPGVSNGAAEKASSAVDAAATFSDRVVTGALASHPLARDVQYDQFSLAFKGHVMLDDTRLELNYGRRYGLLGANGCGKSTLLRAVASREVPVPEHIDVFLLDREVEAGERTALQAVVDHVAQEHKRIEAEAERIVAEDPESDLLFGLYERLEELEPELAEKKAGEILHGLGFTKEMQGRATKDFSGGWRMRISLARALFSQPMMLLLDEPTNHLDLEACVWLEEFLKSYKRCLVIVSHSQDFLNGVCTNIILMRERKLTYYTGNFDAYVQTRKELEENQQKKWKWEQDQIAHMKEYIARFGHGSAKLARQAQSKEKTLKKMVDAGLTEKVKEDKVVSLRFGAVDRLPPPVLTFTDVAFAYPGGETLYRNVEMGLDMDSRMALVGPNGAGKSTLLKLMVGELQPTEGMVRRHSNLRLGWYHQHLAETLDLDLTPLQYLMREFEGVEIDAMRTAVGRFGLTGKQQTTPIGQLSDGQRSRIIFAWLAWKSPGILLLDEPTNHLDIETIDALADAINHFEGGVCLVSHDFRLLDQVAKEIWECNHKSLTRWQGDIFSYKTHLRSKMGLE